MSNNLPKDEKAREIIALGKEAAIVMERVESLRTGDMR